MKTFNMSKKTILIVLTLLLVFGFINFSEKDSQFFNEKEKVYNPFFKDLPEKYIQLLDNQPIDVINIIKKKAVYETLKFDAHLLKHELYQELILIKKVKETDTLITKKIRFKVYPKNKKIIDKKHLTFVNNVVVYNYNKENYQVVRQVLPSIEIDKIVPYTTHWQTLIDSIDNSSYSYKEKDQGRISVNQANLKTQVGIESSIYGFLFEKELKEKNISFLPSSSGLKKVHALNNSVFFKKHLKNNNIQLMKVPDDILFWRNITKHKKLVDLSFVNLKAEKLNLKLQSYFEGSLLFSEVFDIEKLSSYYALLNLYSNNLDRTLYLRYNEQSSLFEPFFIDKILGELNTYLKNLEIFDYEFSEKYVNELKRTSSLSYTNLLVIENRKKIKEMLGVLHSHFPYKLFDESIFFHNKLIIEKALNPSTIVKIDLIEYGSSRIKVEVDNWSSFPIEIKELSYNGKKYIASPNKESSIIPLEGKENVVFNLPKSYNNLFVHKKRKSTGFIFEKDIFKLRIGYRLLGTEELLYNEITPFTDSDDLASRDDLFRGQTDFKEFSFLDIDKQNKLITFNSNSVTLSKPLVFPKGYTIIGKEGLKIDIVDGGKIISKSPLKFLGTANNHIRIFSSDGKGQGLIVISAKITSELRFVDFNKLTNPRHGLWDVTGAVTFYESPIVFDHVLVTNNTCEDAINIVRTHFKMSNTTVSNTQSDAFDGDFVAGEILDCVFQNLGNDAIDVSGSKLKLSNLSISFAGDKAISAGEDSNIIAEKIKISNSEIAVAGKDLSKVVVNNIVINTTKLGFTAFQKKPEFGASDIIATNVILSDVETPHLIEKKSSLNLNDKEAATTDEVKSKMYGIEFGVDSKETRVKKE